LDGPLRISRHARVEAAWVAATASMTVAAVTIVLQLWRANPRVPFAYASDVNLNATIIKGMIETGWYHRIPALGAPFFYDMHDFPLGGDNLQLVLLKLMTLVSSDWALIMNVYFVLTFVLVSAVAYVVLRRLGVSRWLALGLANAFSLLPYHFIPGEHHLLLSGYFVVPLAALLIQTVLAGGVAGEGPRWRRWLGPVALCVVIAMGGGYYAFFTVLLVGAAGGLALLSPERRAGALHAGIFMAAIVGVGALNNLPSLLYWQEHGRNDQVAQRVLGESNLFALHAADLILPQDNHRIGLLDAIADERNEADILPALTGPPNAGLGALGTTGLIVSLLVLVAPAVGAGFGRRLGARRDLVASFGILSLVGILFGSVGGLSLLIALAGFLQIRVWARIHVFIAFLSLAALGLALPAAIDWLRERRSTAADRLPWMGAAVAGAVVVIALVDQTTVPMVPTYAANRAQFTSDRGFVEDVERLMPQGAMVFQLPIVSYPEQPPVVRMHDYALFRGYLHSDTLRWSYGAMRGRPEDWTRELAGRPLEDVMRQVAAAGFSGIYIDREGFEDRAHELEVHLTAALGPAVVFSRDARLSFFDLRDYAAGLRSQLGPEATAKLGERAVRPVRPTFGAGFYPLQFTPPSSGYGDAPFYPRLSGQSTSRLAQSTATLELVNPLASVRPVHLTFGLASATQAAGTLDVVAGPTRTRLDLTPATARRSIALDLPPGTTTVNFTSSVPAGEGAYSFRLDDFLIDDAGSPTNGR
jgi:hypothetical protein